MKVAVTVLALAPAWLVWAKQHLLSPLLVNVGADRGRAAQLWVASTVGFEKYLNDQYHHAIQGVQQAMSPQGAARGAMQASPSRNHPDYYYHWVRDAALTMGLVNELYADARNPEEMSTWERILLDHATFSKQLQETDNPSHGLGEPKFHMDGSAFWQSWGRPQNDGPAIRAAVVGAFGQLWAQRGGDLSQLYQAQLPAQSVIKRDLEYTAHHWQEPSFDIWEEVSGHHFFNRMVSRKAMRDGAALARSVNDWGAANYYLQQAHIIEDDLDQFWDQEKGYIVATRGVVDGLNDKSSGLDVQVLLAALHGAVDKDDDDERYALHSDRMLATAYALITRFKALYAVNRNHPALAPAIGRYPEDQYDGYDRAGGNPWVLATACMAEVHYRVAQTWLDQGALPVTTLNWPFLKRASPAAARISEVPTTVSNDHPLFERILKDLKAAGDQFLQRIQFHARADLNLFEQWHHTTGNARGAPDLTWSYAAFITAVRARNALML
ncbi:hypothetical protein H4R35_002356 [Dimargaris xerosporica]|nr:hypothetical protein H4R35_002356 [Dimargaris xerosporica]